MNDEIVSTTLTPPGETESVKFDSFFIGAIACLCIGGILLIIGIVRLTVWIVKIRKDNALEKRKQRHLQHMRHLEEYCIKAGDSPNDVIIKNNNTAKDNDSVFKWDEGLVNAGYIGEDTLNRHSPKEPKLNAHMNGSRSSYIQMSNAGSQPNSRPSSRASTSSYGSGAQGMANGHASVGDNKGESVSGTIPRKDRLADVKV